jgi:serine/threonine-protein kinase RsbW
MTLRLGDSATSLRRVLHASPGAVDMVCLELRSFMQANDRAHDAFAVELLAREALNNAVLHGNQSNPQKTVLLELRLGRRWLRLQVTDEGPGFDWRAARLHSAQPSDLCGRGLSISARYADRVGFNQRGNQITLWLEKCGSAKRHQYDNLHA